MGKVKPIFFLWNPSRRFAREKTFARLATWAKAKGWQPVFGTVQRDSDVPHDFVKQALSIGCTRFVVVGGDGTIHRTINAMAANHAFSKMSLAIIPAGTCNDFARVIGLSRRRFRKSVRCALEGTVRSVDLGMAPSNVYFLNNAGFGRQPIRGRLPKGTIQTIRSFRAIPVHMTWDHGDIEGAYFIVMIGNGCFFSGGLHFSRTESLSDGLLDVYLVPAQSKFRLVRALLPGRFGRPLRTRGLLHVRTKRLRLRTDTDIWLQADGETLNTTSRVLDFSVSPQKVMMVFPKP